METDIGSTNPIPRGYPGGVLPYCVAGQQQAIILRPRHLDRPRSDSGWPNDLSDQTDTYPREAVAALSHVLFRPRSNLPWPWCHVVSFELQRAWSRVPEERSCIREK
jgi:hypothetical protein